MGNWYQISNTAMLIILGLSVLWAAAGMVLYSLFGVKHGPNGGIDKIADAVVYVFVWRIAIFGVPVVVSAVSFILWLYHNHLWAVKWLGLALAAFGLFLLLYEKYLKKFLKHLIVLRKV